MNKCSSNHDIVPYKANEIRRIHNFDSGDFRKILSRKTYADSDDDREYEYHIYACL